jgi:hypothetical protein
MSRSKITSSSTDESVAKISRGSTEPSNPSEGDLWFDTSSGGLKARGSSKWETMFNPFVASGGTTGTFTKNGKSWKYHRFTSSGTFSVSGGETTGEVLIVGGGGGGAPSLGGAGAGAEVVHLTGYTFSAGNSYTITVGAGGANSNGSGNVQDQAGNAGSASYFATQIAGPGGPGAQRRSDGMISGYPNSGGAGTSNTSSGAVDATLSPNSLGAGYVGTVYSGHHGATGYDSNNHPCGGGGGAGGDAKDMTGNTDGQGDGGVGIQINIDGNNYYWGGGGGGAQYNGSFTGGNGGLGGGGGGGCGSSGGLGGGSGGGSALNSGSNGTGPSDPRNGGNGGANTGGGGGGAGWDGTNNGGAGGSGIVIVAYEI